MRMNEKIMNYKFDGSRVFFTSDTHFNHTNIIRFCSRPFKDVEHMNETLIANWNRVVGPDNIVGNYILLCTISKTIKGHMIMYPFIIQSFFSFFFPFPSFFNAPRKSFPKKRITGICFWIITEDAVGYSLHPLLNIFMYYYFYVFLFSHAAIFFNCEYLNRCPIFCKSTSNLSHSERCLVLYLKADESTYLCRCFLDTQ